MTEAFDMLNRILNKGTVKGHTSGKRMLGKENAGMEKTVKGKEE